MAVKIYQYADFVVKSNVLSPDDVTAARLLEPSRVSWRGARSKEPMIPQTNIWCRRALGVGSVDELVRELVELIEPLSVKLGSLIEDGAATATIGVMRSFGDDAGVEGDLGLPENLARLPGQHQLLGFHLDVDPMKRLVALSCSGDFDEYAWPGTSVATTARSTIWRVAGSWRSWLAEVHVVVLQACGDRTKPTTT